MSASMFWVRRSCTWLIWVGPSPFASTVMILMFFLPASASTDCLIWLKKFACRLATARPIFLTSAAWAEPSDSATSAAEAASVLLSLILFLRWFSGARGSLSLAGDRPSLARWGEAEAGPGLRGEFTCGGASRRRRRGRSRRR